MSCRPRARRKILPRATRSARAASLTAGLAWASSASAVASGARRRLPRARITYHRDARFAITSFQGVDAPMATAPLILLTGATGFVGQQLLRALSERGCRVLPVVGESKQGDAPLCDAISPLVARLDIFAEDADWWARACRGVNTVIHAAWYAEPGQYLQSAKNQEGLSGPLRLPAGQLD